MGILIAIQMLSTAFAYSGFTHWLTRVMSKLPAPAITTLVAIVVVCFVLGCLVGSMGMVFLSIPIFLPLIKALEYDPIWFGVITVCACEIAFITPPVAMNIYVTAKVAGYRTEEVISGIWPFVIRDLIALAILILFPKISLWLPSMMRRTLLGRGLRVKENSHKGGESENPSGLVTALSVQLDNSDHVLDEKIRIAAWNRRDGKEESAIKKGEMIF